MTRSPTYFYQDFFVIPLIFSSLLPIIQRQYIHIRLTCGLGLLREDLFFANNLSNFLNAVDVDPSTSKKKRWFNLIVGSDTVSSHSVPARTGLNLSFS